MFPLSIRPLLLSHLLAAGDSYGSPVKEPVVVIQTSGWKPITNPPRPAGVTSSLSSSYRPPASPAPHPATIQASFTPQQPISTVGYQPPPVGNNFAQPVGTSYQPSGITKQPSSYQPSSSTSYSPPQPISTGYTPGGITQQPFGSTFEPSQPNGFSSQPTSTVPLRPSDIYQPAGPTLTPSTPFLPNQPAVEATPDSYGVPESDPISVTSTKDTGDDSGLITPRHIDPWSFVGHAHNLYMSRPKHVNQTRKSYKFETKSAAKSWKSAAKKLVKLEVGRGQTHICRASHFRRCFSLPVFAFSTPW